MRIILFGAPGSGKGTQAETLSTSFNLRRISLGDILRQEVARGTELGQRVKKFMEKGVLVSDDLVSQVIDEHIDHTDFILDGYPRNLNQAETLEAILKKKGKAIDTFIYLEIDTQTLMHRLTKRRICKNCGANYHLDNMPPRIAGICDSCGTRLIQRKDDEPAVIEKRWGVFQSESRRLLEFYRHKNKLITIDARGNKDVVFEKIKNTLLRNG
jgi:adenylate kinase